VWARIPAPRRSDEGSRDHWVSDVDWFYVRLKQVDKMKGNLS